VRLAPSAGTRMTRYPLAPRASQGNRLLRNSPSPATIAPPRPGREAATGAAASATQPSRATSGSGAPRRPAELNQARGPAAAQSAASSDPSCQPAMADARADVTGAAPGGLEGVSSHTCRARAGNICRNELAGTVAALTRPGGWLTGTGLMVPARRPARRRSAGIWAAQGLLSAITLIRSLKIVSAQDRRSFDCVAWAIARIGRGVGLEG